MPRSFSELQWCVVLDVLTNLIFLAFHWLQCLLCAERRWTESKAVCLAAPQMCLLPLNADIISTYFPALFWLPTHPSQPFLHPCATDKWVLSRLTQTLEDIHCYSAQTLFILSNIHRNTLTLAQCSLQNSTFPQANLGKNCNITESLVLQGHPSKGCPRLQNHHFISCLNLSQFLSIVCINCKWWMLKVLGVIWGARLPYLSLRDVPRNLAGCIF